MKKLRFNLFIYLLAGVTVYTACRKTDTVAEIPPDDAEKEKFFTRHASNDPLVQSLTYKMQRENKQQPFISTIISRIGYPRWDKSLVAGGEGIRSSGRGNNLGDSVNIVYIPFVRDSQNFVNASLLFKVSPTDTSYQYLLDWEYANYGFDTTGEGWNAKDVFHVFANFDRAVFGRTAFEITDDRLYGTPDAGEKVVVKLRPAAPSGQRSNILVPFTVCSVEDVCYGPAWYNSWCNGECNTSCEFYTHTETSCFTYWIEDGWTPAGGGQTGGGSGGGSTGGSGGYPPPQCPGVAARNGVLPGNCQPGWIPPEGGGMMPPEPIDSILSKYSTAIKPRLDSLLAKSLQMNWEYSMIIVKKGDSIYLKNEKTIQDSISTAIDFTLAAGEVLLGYVHCHPSSSLNQNDRSGPSGSDVKALSLKLTKNFVQMTECGNAAYAMVIEDSAKAKRFLDSLGRSELDSRIRDSALKVTGWFSNWQNATLVALKNVIGASSKNGIGLYRTTDPMRKSWIKLN